ncbi:penicillin-binding protein transpeptidase, partial [Candidatus Magnetomorum sp. HK-1]
MNAGKYCIPYFIIIGFMIRLITLQHADFLPPSEVKQEDELLFHQLIQSKLLETTKNTDRLKLPRKDYELIEKARRAQNPDLPDLTQNEIARCELIHALYYSAPGRFVINQIQQWNQRRQLAGIRDNRPQKIGDFKNEWQIMNTSGTFQTIPFMSEQFGYINHGELRSDFSNWLVVHPFKHDDFLRFQTQVHVNRDYHFTVQLIGSEPVKITETLIGSAPVQIYPAKNVSWLKPICSPHVSTKNKCNKQLARAFEIHFSLKKGRHQINIETQGIQNPHITEPGMHIQRDDKTLAFNWSSMNRRTFIKTDAPFIIRTADGVALTDSHGNPTPFTLENGLIPLIGIGKKTPFALYGLLARSQIPLQTNEIILSINSHIQAIAQQTLRHHINQMCMRDKKYGKKKYCKQRKASVVILNAKTGAILAAANHPLPPKNIHPWDLLTFDRFFSKNNPMTLQAWQGIGSHSAPGSSFKPVVVMAALDMQSYKNVNHMVQELSNASPLHDKASSIKDFYQSCISKNSKTYWKTKIFPCFTKPKNYSLTMTDAIMFSNNEWHKRLAVLMDGEKAFSYDSESLHNTSQFSDLPEFNLCRMAKRLGFGSFIDLAPHLDHTIRIRPDGNKNIEG